MQNPELPPHLPAKPLLSVRALASDGNGRFAVGQRANGECAGQWELLGGGVEEGETYQETAIREAYEEGNILMYPTTQSFLIQKRIIPDGKYAGRPQYVFGCFGVVEEPEKLSPGEDIADVRWLTPDHIRFLANVAESTEFAATHLLR